MLDELGKLDPSSGVAPYRQIAAWLYAVIRNATPGTRLPSNVALATHFGVARMTIRAAVAELAHDGLVGTRQGSGVFVAGHGGRGTSRSPKRCEPTSRAPGVTSCPTPLWSRHATESPTTSLAGPSTSWAPRDSNATSGASPSGSAPTPPNSR